MTPEAILALLYPYLLDADDPRSATEQQRTDALGLAAGYRPLCLPLDKQNEAQAHYAAHLLSTRAQLRLGGSSSTSTTEATKGGAVTEWSDGQVTIKYAPPTAASTKSSSSSGISTSGAIPAHPFLAWKALADLCDVKDPTQTAQAAAKKFGGALLTGWG